MIKHKRGRPCIKKPYVYEVVKQRIISGVYPPGTCIPSTEELAYELRMSMFPVHNALTKLQKEGWLERRHGSGTYVSDNPPAHRMMDTILLAMNAQGHLFSDISVMLLNKLHNHGNTVMLLDMSHNNAAELLQKILKSDLKTCIIHGSKYFPFRKILPFITPSKNFISIIDFAFSNDNVQKILVDHAEGGRIVADWLQKKGIKDVLVIGTPMQIAALNSNNLSEMPAAFRKAFDKAKGKMLTLASDTSDPNNVQLNKKKLVDMVKNVRAIFGLRDVEALMAKRILMEHNNALLDEIEFIGYGNTPWSRTEGLAFSSVDWQLDKIAERACEIVLALHNSEKPKEAVSIRISPRIIER